MRLMMSDLNDLIHTNAVIAFQQGEKRERERIIKLIYEGQWVSESLEQDVPNLIALIKGEQK